MSCSNCYNGCPQIISDQCVKYTGIDIPVLGIKNGDSLSYVEQAIITFLTSTLDGSGIKVNIDQNIICQIVSKNLPTCGDLTVVDFIKSLVQAVCELKTLVDGNTADITTINNFIDNLEAAYDVDCLSGVTSTSGTHDILQAVIDRLCAFIIDVDVTFVKLDDLDDLIAAYLSGTTSATKYYTRMVPFMATPFFPTSAVLAKFNNGVGQDEWENIYLCNGANGTPDLRGRIPVGVTDGTMGGGALPTAVNPASSPLNPNYTALPTISYLGANGTSLTESQLPAHTHIANTGSSTVTINPSSHNHNVSLITGGSGVTTDGIFKFQGSIFGTNGITRTFTSTSQTLTTTANIVVTNNPTGGNQAHSNVQPGVGCYYIIYIP
jgi:microcystin-dependent protein